MQAFSLLPSWYCYPCCNGVDVVDAQAPLKSRHLCHHCNNVVALVAMELLLSSSWCYFPCHNGVTTIVDAQVSLPLSSWCCHPCCTVVIANIARGLLPLLHRHHHHFLADLFALTLHGHCHHHFTGVVTPVKLACLRRGVWV